MIPFTNAEGLPDAMGRDEQQRIEWSGSCRLMEYVHVPDEDVDWIPAKLMVIAMHERPNPSPVGRRPVDTSVPDVRHSVDNTSMMKRIDGMWHLRKAGLPGQGVPVCGSVETRKDTVFGFHRFGELVYDDRSCGICVMAWNKIVRERRAK